MEKPLVETDPEVAKIMVCILKDPCYMVVLIQA